MDILFILACVAIAAAIGFYFGQKIPSNNKERERLESALKSKQAQLDEFRSQVSNHFEKTAELFSHVSDSYQSLYDHMARGSGQLCATKTFQSLPPNAAIQTPTPPSSNQAQQDTDGAAAAPGKPNANTHKAKNSQNLFDANRLYNAYDYHEQGAENNEQAEVPLQPQAATAQVVNIESAKEELSEPALDYAVKQEGTVNHNSLSSVDTKNS